MQELQNSKSIDMFLILFAMAENYYDEKTTIKKIDISREKAVAEMYKFFDYISNKSPEVRKALIKYYNTSYFNDKIEGFVFSKNGKVSKVAAPVFNNLYSTSIGIHEYTHALNFDSISKLNNRYEYEEILPFLNQFLFLEFVDKKYDSKEVIDSSKYFMLQKQLFLNIKNFMKIVKEMDINDNAKTKHALYNKLMEHYKYIIGSLYSLLLYEYYKMDERLFMREYKKLYKSDKKIDDLLNYYSISLENKENILLVKNLVKEVH